LSIANTNGRTTVEATDTDTIEVTAERIVRAGTEEAANEQLAAFEMNDSAGPDQVSIDTSTRGLTMGISRRVNYTVRVPRGVSVTLTATNGEIVATGIGGAFDASTTNGRITGIDLSGSASASTTNGVIALTMRTIADDGVRA